MAARPPTDPLRLLPPEIVLRILEFSPTSSLANLTRLNRSWHNFIDKIHQEAVYSDPSRTPHPPTAKDFGYLKDSQTFSLYYHSVTSWKDLCRRQTLLAKNWNRQEPLTRESMIRVGTNPIWRFKPDFQRRIVLTTSHAGGLYVTDMDSGDLLWNLDNDAIRPFAHLEYQDGTAVLDKEGDRLEVWRTGMDGLTRGQFAMVTVLDHDRMTRGFQLSYNTLCVVSNEGIGYVYEDMLENLRLARTIDIEEGAVGHLDQGEDVVAYSMGNGGFHFFSKKGGESLGILDPEDYDQVYHIKHPDEEFHRGPRLAFVKGQESVFPPRLPVIDRTVTLKIQKGHLRDELEGISIAEDEWGAGLLQGDLFVGVSRGGRVMVCSNWRKAVSGKHSGTGLVSIIECDTDGTDFDLGGWLSVRDHRVMFEIRDLTYIVGLTDDDEVRDMEASNLVRPSFATASSMECGFAVPVSFMGIYDDCIMSTFTTIHLLPSMGEDTGDPVRRRHITTKAIRILSFAPDLNANPNGDPIPRRISEEEKRQLSSV